MALLCPWWNLESLAQRGMMDERYWNSVFPFSDFLLKDSSSSNLTGVWKIRHLLRSVRCDGAKGACHVGLVASLAPVQPQQSLREHIIDSQLPSLISLYIFLWSISEANPKNNRMRGEQACLIDNDNDNDNGNRARQSFWWRCRRHHWKPVLTNESGPCWFRKYLLEC